MSKQCELRLSRSLGFLLLACAVFLGSGCVHTASAYIRTSPGVDYYYAGDYDLLAHYGDWMRVAPYGVVWCPYADAGWAPFYDGRWIWTSYGWAWDSYEPFGELVYHYGYWYYDYDIGWFWVPGDEWSPACVQWYSYGGYCGWAPLPPPGAYWVDPWDYCDINIWIIVQINDFCDDHIGRRRIDPPRHRELLRRDAGVASAPDIRHVKTLVHREIPLKTIAKRTMNLRTDQIEAAERSTTLRTIKMRESAAVQRDTGESRQIAENTASERTVVTRRSDSQTERQAVETSRNVQSERKVVASRPVSQTQGDAAAAKQPAQVERKTVVTRQDTQTQREAAATRETAQTQRTVEAAKRPAQTQRETAAPRQAAQPQRETAAARQTTQAERKVDTSARSAQPAQSRTAERSSDRSAGARNKR